MLSKNNKRFKEKKTQQQENPPKFSPIPQSLSLFVSFAESFSYDLFTKSSPTSKSPRKSFDDGAVGLGIVAAMIDSAATKPAVSFRSDPVPIFSARAAAAKMRRPIWKEDEEMEMELSETYTLVISHVGGKSVRKRVYYDDGYDDIGAGKFKSEPVVLFFNSPPPVKPAPPLPADDFLSCCYLCKKKLHGMDIFMYRGEKPFCSPECRSQHILRDEHWEKRASEALKPFDCAGSPCSAHPLFSAGIAAA